GGGHSVARSHRRLEEEGLRDGGTGSGAPLLRTADRRATRAARADVDREAEYFRRTGSTRQTPRVRVPPHGGVPNLDARSRPQRQTIAGRGAAVHQREDAPGGRAGRGGGGAR